MENTGRNIFVVKGRNRLILPKYVHADSNLNPTNEESDLFHFPKEDHPAHSKASVSDLKKFWENKSAKPLIPSSPTWQKSPCLRKVCLKSRQRRFQQDFTSESLTPASPLAGQKRKHKTPRRLMSLCPERYSQLMSPSTTASPNKNSDSLLIDNSWASEESETPVSEKPVRLSLNGISPFVESISLNDSHDKSLQPEVKYIIKDVVKVFTNTTDYQSIVIEHENEFIHKDNDDEVNHAKVSEDKHDDNLVEGSGDHEKSFNLSLLSNSDIENDKKEDEGKILSEQNRALDIQNKIGDTKVKMLEQLGLLSCATVNVSLTEQDIQSPTKNAPVKIAPQADYKPSSDLLLLTKMIGNVHEQNDGVNGKFVGSRSSEFDPCVSPELHCYESSMSSNLWPLKENVTWSATLDKSLLLNSEYESEMKDENNVAFKKLGRRRNLKRPKRLQFDEDLSKDKDIYVPSPKLPKTPLAESRFEFSTVTPNRKIDSDETELSECEDRGTHEYGASSDIENEYHKTPGHDSILCTDYDTDFLNEALSDVSIDMDMDIFSDYNLLDVSLLEGPLTVDTELLPWNSTDHETNQIRSFNLGTLPKTNQTHPLSLHSEPKVHHTSSFSLGSQPETNQTNQDVTSTLDYNPKAELGCWNQISKSCDHSASWSYVEIQQPMDLSRKHNHSQFQHNACECNIVPQPVPSIEDYSRNSQPQVPVLERDTSSLLKEFGMGTDFYGYQPNHDSTHYAAKYYNTAVSNSPAGHKFFAKPLEKREEMQHACRYMGGTVTVNKPVNVAVEVNAPVVQSIASAEDPTSVLSNHTISDGFRTDHKNDNLKATDVISQMESNVRQRLVDKRRCEVREDTDQLPEVLKDVHPYVISGSLSSTYLMAMAKKTDLINEMFNDPLDTNGEILGWIVENCNITSPSVFATDLLFRLFTLGELHQHSLTFLGHSKRYRAIKQCVSKQFSLNSNSWRKCVIRMKSAINSMLKYRVPQVQEVLMLHSGVY